MKFYKKNFKLISLILIAWVLGLLSHYYFNNLFNGDLAVSEFINFDSRPAFLSRILIWIIIGVIYQALFRLQESVRVAFKHILLIPIVSYILIHLTTTFVFLFWITFNEPSEIASVVSISLVNSFLSISKIIVSILILSLLLGIPALFIKFLPQNFKNLVKQFWKLSFSISLFGFGFIFFLLERSDGEIIANLTNIWNLMILPVILIWLLTILAIQVIVYKKKNTQVSFKNSGIIFLVIELFLSIYLIIYTVMINYNLFFDITNTSEESLFTIIFSGILVIFFSFSRFLNYIVLNFIITKVWQRLL